jgi:RimJ/RimL family protein N-acetyltransferase
MLLGKYVRLRIMDSTDAEYVRRLRNSPSIVRWFQSRHFISDSQQRVFVQSLTESTTHLYFIGETILDERPYGVYCIRNIDHRNQRAEIGWFVDDEAPITSFDKFEGAFLLLDYGFGYLNLCKVCAEVLAKNERSLRFCTGLGMQPEGVLRQHVFAEGWFQDIVRLAIFREDFYNRPTTVMQRFFGGRRRPLDGQR